MKQTGGHEHKGAARIQVLAEQIRTREHEIELLKGDLRDKEAIIARLAEPHLDRETQLQREIERLQRECEEALRDMVLMTDALRDAEDSIARLTAEKDSINLQMMELTAENKKKEDDFSAAISRESRWYGRKVLFVGTVAFAVGITPFVLLMAVPFALQFLGGNGVARRTPPAYEMSMPTRPFAPSPNATRQPERP